MKDNEREQLERNLFIMSEAAGQLPEELLIPPKMLKFDGQGVAGNAIYEIYRGKYLTQVVAVKKARSMVYTPDAVKVCFDQTSDCIEHS